MKHSLAFTSLASAGALILGCGFLGCSSEDNDPPAIAPPPTMEPVNGSDTTNTADPDTTNTADPDTTNTADPDTTSTEDPDTVSEDGQMVTDLDPGATDAPPEGMTEDPEETEEPDETPIEEPPPALTLPELVGDLDGHLFTVACGDTPNTDDCAGEGWRSNGGPLNACQGGRLEATLDFPIGGETGAVYDVDMHFYGVMEPRNYGNVVNREAPGRPNAQPGGTPTPFASMQGGGVAYLTTGDNNYNTYELHVLDENGNERFAHFLNADTQTGHYTFGIDYAKNIAVVGGGIMRLRIADANCRQIKNCGAGGVPCIGKARTINIAAADPQPPQGTLQQPGLGKNPEHSGQWLLLDVTGFAAR